MAVSESNLLLPLGQGCFQNTNQSFSIHDFKKSLYKIIVNKDALCMSPIYFMNIIHLSKPINKNFPFVSVPADNIQYMVYLLAFYKINKVDYTKMTKNIQK